jgi:RNA methyltransferase, TrmH family
MRTREISVCGLAAVQALFDKDAGAIKRLFFDYQTSRRVPKITSQLAKAKRIYRVVTDPELEKIAGTVHHGGIVAIIDERPLGQVSPAQIARWAADRTPLLLMDRIGNPHNLGAIARTAAFFGLQHLVIPDHPQQAMPSESAYRVAEGGLEHLQLWKVQDLAEVCRQLGKHYEVVGTAVGAETRPLGAWIKNYRHLSAGAQKPIALVLGNEEKGLSPDVAAACSALVRLVGGGQKIESLNVSVAAAVFIWELWGRGDLADTRPQRRQG